MTISFEAKPKDVEAYLMESNGLYVGFNMPKKLEGKFVNGEELPQKLPPYQPRKSFLVDKYPACPKDWMRSEGKAHSYFVPVKEEEGMWLDFNYQETPYEVACVVSIQGINPITGMPVDDVYLEQYIEECPKHKVKFGPHRFCKECNFKWPKQNYISSTGSLNKAFWLDGFRMADGIVRQYILTSEKMKGVANAIVGEKRVFAIGISFFLSKEKKFVPAPAPKREPEYGAMSMGTLISQSKKQAIKEFEAAQKIYTSEQAESWKGIVEQPGIHFLKVAKDDGSSIVLDSLDHNPAETKARGITISTGGGTTTSALPTMSNTNVTLDWMEQASYFNSAFDEASVSAATSSEVLKSPKKITTRKALVENNKLQEVSARKGPSGQSAGPIRQVTVKKLEVGQGAKIEQRIYDDPNDLDFWRKEPEAIIYLNYCSEEEARAIIEAGEDDLEGKAEGFLDGIPKSI